MPIAKEKSQKPSIWRRADMHVAPRASAKKGRAVSTEQIAEQFCEEMIQNLKRNVAEDKQRLAS